MFSLISYNFNGKYVRNMGEFRGFFTMVKYNFWVGSTDPMVSYGKNDI